MGRQLLCQRENHGFINRLRAGETGQTVEYSTGKSPAVNDRMIRKNREVPESVF